MDLTPLGDRILIAPDPVVEQTASGLHLIEHWPDEVSGRVVAIGRPTHPRKEEAFQHAEWLEQHIEGFAVSRGYSVSPTAQLLRELTGREPEVKVGDRVLFTRGAGQEIRIDDTRYFLMRERDLLAVLEDAE